MDEQGQGKEIKVEPTNISRQLKRQKEREEFKKQDQMRKQFNLPATKAELYQVMESFGRLRDRMFHLDIFTAAIEKALSEKGVVTREEMEEAFTYEGKRAAKYNEINNEKGNYITRLEVCKEWNIDPSVTQIPDQMLADTELTEEKRLEYANTYNIKRLLEIEENRKKIEEKLEGENK